MLFQSRQRPGRSRPHRSSRAFSLIEVVLALGVISIALLAVVGIVPAGLKSLSSARESSVEAQVLASVGAEVRRTPYSDIRNRWVSRELYFDTDGLPLLAGGRRQAAYRAVVADIETGLGLPGGLTTQSLTRVHVEIGSVRPGSGWSEPFARLAITIAEDGS